MFSNLFKAKTFPNKTFLIGVISVVPIFSDSEAYANDALTFHGNRLKEMSLDVSKDTGIDKIFILYDLDNVSVSYQSSSGNVRWMRYSNLGGAFSEELSDLSVDGNIYTLSSPVGDSGYIIYDNDRAYTFWLVDYSNYKLEIGNINIPSSQECDTAELDIECSASPIHFYTISGRQETLDRDITVEYNTLLWNDESQEYIQESLVKSFASISDRILVTPPPYCNTYFTISGDRFLRYWDMPQSKESALYVTTATDCHTEAIQNDDNSDDSSNRIDTDVDGLGGSAPCEISFNAFVTDAVIHNEWQMANDEEFEDITYRINEQNFTYSFTEEGVTYVRYIGSNSDGSCESYGDVYTVSIGASELLIPNAFSPNGDGVNDIWKVSYRSLIDFECWIFDKQGHQLYHFNNPSGGWDGKHNGKIVKSGVYYYVIQATGSDGKKYKRSGDINIIKFRGNSSSVATDN